MPFFTREQDCRLYYEVDGFTTDLPLVAFLNATAQTTVNWRQLRAAFAGRFRQLRYDGRAQGRSDTGTRPLALDLHAADLIALLDYLQVPRSHLVGLSHGARVALACAGRFPQRVDRIVLSGLAAGWEGRCQAAVRSWKAMLKGDSMEAMAWSALPLAFGNAFLRRHRPMLPSIVQAVAQRNRPQALRVHLEAMADYPAPEDMLSAGGLPPTLVLAGDDDPLAPPAGARRLAELCSAQFRLIEGSGHSLPAEAPEAFAARIINFLEGK